MLFGGKAYTYFASFSLNAFRGQSYEKNFKKQNYVAWNDLKLDH